MSKDDICNAEHQLDAAWVIAWPHLRVSAVRSRRWRAYRCVNEVADHPVTDGSLRTVYVSRVTKLAKLKGYVDTERGGPRLNLG